MTDCPNNGRIWSIIMAIFAAVVVAASTISTTFVVRQVDTTTTILERLATIEERLDLYLTDRFTQAQGQVLIYRLGELEEKVNEHIRGHSDGSR